MRRSQFFVIIFEIFLECASSTTIQTAMKRTCIPQSWCTMTLFTLNRISCRAIVAVLPYSKAQNIYNYLWIVSQRIWQVNGWNSTSKLLALSNHSSRWILDEEGATRCWPELALGIFWAFSSPLIRGIDVEFEKFSVRGLWPDEGDGKVHRSEKLR